MTDSIAYGRDVPVISAPELLAVRRALAVETNPNHLVGFASTLAPEHAVLASLLYARAQVIERRREMDPRLLVRALTTIRELAAVTDEPLEPALVDAKIAIDTFARATNVDPRILEHDILCASGDLVIDKDAPLTELPPPAALLARKLVAELTPGVRFVRPVATRLCRCGPEFTTPEQRAERDQWIRQYIREHQMGPSE